MKHSNAEMKRVIVMNEMMRAENKNDYDAMQELAMIAVLSRRLGKKETAEIAEGLVNEISHRFIKPVQ